MTDLSPESVQPRPPLESPPRCRSGLTTMTVLPIFFAWTAAMMAAEVPP